MKKLALILVLSMGLSAVTTTVGASERFSDVPEWARTSVEKAAAEGIVDGYEDGTFRPDQPVSRAEFVKLVASSLKLPTDRADSASTWYQSYVSAAVAAGIHRYEDFDQDVNGAITRQEMMRLVVRATDSKLQSPDVHMDDVSFAYNAVKSGLIQGLPGGELGLSNSTTRAQAVTVIDRIKQKNAGVTFDPDKYALAQAELQLKKTNLFVTAPDLFGGEVRRAAWNTDNLTVETPDGKYKGVIDEIVIIDFEDDDDPNLNLLGEFDKLRWSASGNQITYHVKEYRQSYGLVVKAHMVYSNDSSVYNQRWPVVNITGIKSPDGVAFRRGELNTWGRLIGEDNQILSNVFIIPKHGLETSGYIVLSVNAPAIPPNPNYSHSLLDVYAPKKVE